MNSILETETQTEAISNTIKRSHSAEMKRNYEKKNTYNSIVYSLIGSPSRMHSGEHLLSLGS